MEISNVVVDNFKSFLLFICIVGQLLLLLIPVVVKAVKELDTKVSNGNKPEH